MPDTGFDTIQTERRGEVLVITLDRPDRLNAWTPHMSEELCTAIGDANAAADIGAIVMTGGGRAFCAGADMRDTFSARLEGNDPGADTANGQGGMPAGLDWVAFCRGSKPLLAAVNGAAVGVGMTMVLPFDVILASPNAKFSMAFIKVGLVPELASTHFLVQRMGFGRASAMTLSGQMLSGETAFASGLVDVLVEPDALVDQAVELATSIAANPAPQLQMIKELFTANACETDLDRVQSLESKYLRQCWESPEHAEAVSAFLAKRPPQFPPRQAVGTR
ncbi:MAG TPA: enoyl-CoA hydratase/isomerase family protein [Acidimicrobiales bacterium]|jgi:enoyl-CoA hydratase/carnithine racemase|nr:enoyl-CoA hydratase/isomerase family protein [Acidimicrobiales bacterium]